MITTTNDLGYVVLEPKLAKKLAGVGFQPKHLEDFDRSIVLSTLPTESRGEHPDIDSLPFVPKLRGSDIVEHYETIANELLEPYRPQSLLKTSPLSLPPSEALVYLPGWVRYTFDLETGWHYERVEEIAESAFVYDCETFVKGSDFGHPVIGTALSDKAYYVWLHPALCSEATYTPMLPGLRHGKSFVVMHNSAFDSVRVLDKYQPLDPNRQHFYFDTMSGQQLVAGCDSNQRFLLANKDIDELGEWAEQATTLSLKACYEHWMKVKLPDDIKDPRKLFVTADDISLLRERLKDCVAYALQDCYLTLAVFQHQYPQYLTQSNSKVVLAAHMLLNQAVLPVQDDWYDWVKHCESEYNILQDKINTMLRVMVDQVYNSWLVGGFEQTSWSEGWDWSMPSSGKNKGIPRWYTQATKKRIGTKSLISHDLLRLSYNGSPVFMRQDMGWCYGDKANPVRIPHKEGVQGKNVGNLLTKDYIRYFDEGWLTSESELAKEIIEANTLCTYWSGYRSRLHSMLAQETKLGLLISPQSRVHGTVTGRTIEPTWCTLASRGKPRIGSELRAKIKAPVGFKLVSFDTDQQELQIARIYADSYLGVSGSTPFSYQVLAGDKASQTDMHSASGKLAGISRDAAKQVIYGILYGAGLNTTTKTILAYHAHYSKTEAEKKSKTLMNGFKGRKDWDSGLYMGGTASAAFNKMTELIKADDPLVPILNVKLPPAITPKLCGQTSKPSQLNYVVQAAGSTYGLLACLVLGICYLLQYYGVRYWFGGSVHDEVLFIVDEADAEFATYLMQIAHAWSWALAHFKLGLGDIPYINAFASGISIDDIWRKSPSKDPSTPTFTYTGKPGVELTFKQSCAYAATRWVR